MKVLGVTPAHTPLYAYILLAAIGTLFHVFTNAAIRIREGFHSDIKGRED